MRWLGVSILMLGFFALGKGVARRAENRAAALSEAAALCRDLARRMAFDAPPLSLLFAEAAASGRYTHLSFLSASAKEALPPCEGLSRALAAEKRLPKEGVAEWNKCAAFLGRVSAEEAAALLNASAENLAEFLPEYQKKRDETAKLWPSLGLLFGVAIAVVLV